jgi:hypothetical protein
VVADDPETAADDENDGDLADRTGEVDRARHSRCPTRASLAFLRRCRSTVRASRLGSAVLDFIETYARSSRPILLSSPADRQRSQT